MKQFYGCADISITYGSIGTLPVSVTTTASGLTNIVPLWGQCGGNGKKILNTKTYDFKIIAKNLTLRLYWLYKLWHRKCLLLSKRMVQSMCAEITYKLNKILTNNYIFLFYTIFIAH